MGSVTLAQFQLDHTDYRLFSPSITENGSRDLGLPLTTPVTPYY